MHRSVRPGSRRGRRRPAAGVRRVLSPRGALTLHDVDGAFLFAVRAALAMGLVALPIALAGRADLAVYAMLGSFTTTFGRNLPYPRRARVLAVVAVAMTACVGCGSLLAVWAGPQRGAAGAVVVVAATALVAGAAKFVCDATRLSGLGAVLLLFSFAVAANASPTPADVLPYTGLAAVGAACAWLLGVAGRLVHPDRPQRLAVAAALRALAELLEASAAGAEVPRRIRHRATVAVLHAYRCLGCPPPEHDRRPGPRHDAVFLRLTDLSWTLLVRTARQTPDDPARTARLLRRQARLLMDRRRRIPRELRELPLDPGAPSPFRTAGRGAPRPAPAAAARGRTAAERATELLIGLPNGPRHRAALAVPALRMALGTGAAGGVAVLLHLQHGYWAAVSAAAVLHSVNVRTTAQRAVQRTLGTLAGLLLALGVLAAHPSPTALAVVIVALEFLLEYVVARNYALGVVFLTPMALLLSDLAAPAPAGELVLDRVLGSVTGMAVGLLCALLVVHDRAAARVEHALAACRAAAEQAERSLADRAGPPPPDIQVRLVETAVELRDADDAAAGELWPAEIDPSELAAAEQRAYVLLDRLNRRRPRS
ncbi:FUSC family protein [Streptomyces sp. TRM S81-3]|uniref:FUSC family protein n=2 Tax=Streptomyces griseicoloratus TaxID=2752516 RepID=A0A926L8Q5_9ACTN|nr:FUSC family protein [Streptomyces griseicoloratus]MBD0422232.1 FUSC family protein [Streptomyces griseicoloratus]